MSYDYERGYEYDRGANMANRLTIEQRKNVIANWKRQGYQTLAIYVECTGRTTPEFARGYADAFGEEGQE